MSEEESDSEYSFFIIFAMLAIFILALCIKGIEESKKDFRKLVINHTIKIHRDLRLMKLDQGLLDCNRICVMD